MIVLDTDIATLHLYGTNDRLNNRVATAAEKDDRRCCGFRATNSEIEQSAQ